MSLFGSSGIRGLANVEVTPLLAQKVGMAIASQFDGGVVLVGRDTRLSGEMLESALTSGIVSTGFVAGTVGVVPTPVIAWLTREMGAEAGVSITASHNPPEYNGFKIFDSTGMAYTEKQQQDVEDIIGEQKFSRSAWNRVGRVEKMDVGRVYIDSIAQRLEFSKAWSVVYDLFNGATSSIAHDIYRDLEIDAIIINGQPDGHFPAGNPEPTQESLTRVGRMVNFTGADIGFGFDGDGDRFIAVDERGNTPSPDRVLAAYARHLVEMNGGGTVVTHVGSSMCVEEAVEAVKGNVVRTKVGDVHITEAMIENGAIFGGEPVGAWIHPDIHMCPDGILSSLKLMVALESEGKTLSEFLADVPDYPTLRTKVECPDVRKPEAMMGISSNYEKDFGNVKEVLTIDGVRISLEDGWILIRPSGTEPIIRITVEAQDLERAEDLLETGRRFVGKVLGGSR
ncbi:MAG TPA: phosphoglucosamine mutase [Patescibacteria group bacterium]|nr:phosphoglucosamine mutase [Patescibacteria group bacterium]